MMNIRMENVKIDGGGKLIIFAKFKGGNFNNWMCGGANGQV
jgi:hypothetical protein